MAAPSILARNSRAPDCSTVQGPSKCFVGTVYIDPCLSTKDETNASNNTLCATVTFTPGARTNWQWHEKGQLIKVETGSGWVCDKGDQPKKISAGDTIWCPPGVTHWNGADDDSIMSHYVFAMGGVEWYEAVSDEEYAMKSE